MKSPDITSTLVAGTLGAALTMLVLTMVLMAKDEDRPPAWEVLLTGFIVGAGVQTGVRLVGVS